MSNILFNAAFVFYAVGLFHSLVAFFSKRSFFFTVALSSVAVGFALHSGFLLSHSIEMSRFPLTGLRESLAFLAWTVSLCFFLSYFRYRIQALGLFILPLVAALMLGTVLLKSSPSNPDFLNSSWTYLHATSLLLAYGMFFVTFVAGLLYLFQERELKSRQPKRFYYQLPSLPDLDDLFSKFLLSGFCFMTVGILIGVVQAEQDWVGFWQKDPKVIASMTTWMIYLVLIYLRVTAGWRGRRAAVMSLAGFLSVLFTLLGVNFLGDLHRY